MHCYETELVKLHVNVFTPTLNFLIFVSNQTINSQHNDSPYVCYVLLYNIYLFTISVLS